MSGVRISIKTGEITYDAPATELPSEDDIRKMRDQLLMRSDWTQVADAPTDKEAWATYRQALRDVPLQSGFPENVVWPAEPV